MSFAARNILLCDSMKRSNMLRVSAMAPVSLDNSVSSGRFLLLVLVVVVAVVRLSAASDSMFSRGLSSSGSSSGSSRLREADGAGSEDELARGMLTIASGSCGRV